MKRPLSRTPWFGPLGWWEMVRLARRGQGHRARLLVLYFLFIAYILTPILWFIHTSAVELFFGTGQTLSIAESAAFANRAAMALMQAILLAVAVMTPGYAAAALAEEKERGTLLLLLTTPLTDREIVLGKALGRCGFALAAAMAGVPVVVATTLLGGVSGRFLLAGCGLVVSTSVLCIAIGLQAASVAPDLRGALLRAYGLAALLVFGLFVPPFVLLSPFGVLAWLEGSDRNIPFQVLGGIGYPVIQLLVAAGLLADAVFRLRSEDPIRQPPSHLPAPTEPHRAPLTCLPVRPRAPVARPPEPEWHPAPLPKVDWERPLLWKERHVTGRKAGRNDGAVLVGWLFGAFGLLLIGVGGLHVTERFAAETRARRSAPVPPKPPRPDFAAAAVGAVAAYGRPEPPQPPRVRTPPTDEGGRIMMTGGVIVTGVYLIPVAIGLAAAIARERQRQTLDNLLMIPADRGQILRAKVQAVAERGWWWVPIAVTAAGVSFGADGGWEFGAAAVAFLLTGEWLVLGLGVWLTIRCPTEVRALRFLAPAVVAVVGLPVAVWNSTDWNEPEWSALRLGAAAAGFAVAGMVLWRKARRELERLG